jgi:nicotinamidase-related amidase
VLLDASQCQLVLVDYQTRLMPVIHDHQRVLQKAALVAGAARLLDVPVWSTTQSADKLGGFVPQLSAFAGNALDKWSFDACQDGLLDRLMPAAPAHDAPRGGNARSMPKHLRKAKEEPEQAAPRPIIVLAGVEAHVCLLQTAVGLIEQELDVWVVSDASGSRRELDCDATFDRLAGNGVELVTAEMVAFEWLGAADHPNFEQVLELIKRHTV